MSEVICDRCAKQFKARGLKLHQRHCRSIMSSSPQVLKNLTYKFVIINDDVFNNILSFLGNQSLSKLQCATGDKYPNCNPDIIKYCCKHCENDNPAILEEVCTDCHSKMNGYKRLITKTEAKELYGIKDFDGISYEARKHYFLFNRRELDEHMIKLFKSKYLWLESIYKKDHKRLARIKEEERKATDRSNFIKSLSIEFDRYINKCNIVCVSSNKTLQQQYNRFLILRDALKKFNLSIRSDSSLCQEYIFNNSGCVSDIVETMEEMNFLFNHTKYSSQVKKEINQYKKDQVEFGEWIPREEYDSNIQSCRDNVKMKICIEHLIANSDVVLPIAWLRCKIRFNEVVAANINPTNDYASEYIYFDEEDMNYVKLEHDREMRYNAKNKRCQTIIDKCKELNIIYKKIKTQSCVRSYINCNDSSQEEQLYSSCMDYLNNLSKK